MLLMHSPRFAPRSVLCELRHVSYARRLHSTKTPAEKQIGSCNEDPDVIVFTRLEYDALMKRVQAIKVHVNRIKMRDGKDYANLAEEKRDELAHRSGFNGWDDLWNAMHRYSCVQWDHVVQQQLAKEGIDIPLEEIQMLLQKDVEDVRFQKSSFTYLWRLLVPQEYWY